MTIRYEFTAHGVVSVGGGEEKKLILHTAHAKQERAEESCKKLAYIDGISRPRVLPITITCDWPESAL